MIAQEHKRGAIPLEIVYDPQNPKRVKLMSDVFPKSTFSVDEQDSQAS